MLRRIAAVAFSLIPCAELVAQNPATQERAVLQGVVVDSVRGGFLRGATVGLLGPSRMTFTDSLGRFRIDSIPPGEYRVALFDGLLDTLSLDVVSVRTHFAAGDTVRMTLAIPSPRTIVAVKCGTHATTEESSALVGTVRSAGSGAPIAGAEVRFGWLDVWIDRKVGVHTEPQRRVATTDSAGRFRLCRLPVGLSAEISAAKGSDSTATVPIAYGESILAVASLYLPLSSGGAENIGRSAAVHGRVVDSVGKGIFNAVVTLSSSSKAVVTKANGAFLISGERLGTQSLLVRRLGYQPVEIVVHVTPEASEELTVELSEFVPILESVVIGARRQAGLERVGFARRKRSGMGRYWEADEIPNISSTDHFFQTIPMLRRPQGTGIMTRNSNCPRRFLDGVEMRIGIGQMVTPSEIAAVEVYSAAFTPSEFQGINHCPTILVWTKWKLR
jgi:hypothetical protein